MNAILLAGDKGSGAHAFSMNKALLPLEGHPLFLYVLEALDQVRGIERIYIVGPQKKIMQAIEKALPMMFFSKKIEVLEQKESLLQNILYAYHKSLPGYREGIDPGALSHSDQPALFLPADIPLVTAAEIEAFLSASDLNRYDYCMGVSPEGALTRFYPSDGKPGIKMPYLYLKNQVYRINNLHIVRPYRVGMGETFQKLYTHRHQRYFKNRLRMAFEILRSPQWPRGVLYYLLGLGGTYFNQIGWGPAASICRSPLSADRVEKTVSAFLRTRFKAVETGLGGAALDIDDEDTYRTVVMRFREWRSDLAKEAQRENREVCPFHSGTC